MKSEPGTAREGGLKAAVAHLRAKKEEQGTKQEQKVKSEQKAKSERKVKLESSAKSEQNIKAVRKVQAANHSPDWGQALLQRGLTLRALSEKNKSCKSERKNVKREKGIRTKFGKKRKKYKVSAKRRNSSRAAMARVYPLSQELSSFVGATALSRPEAVKRVWAHCKQEGMLNPENKREILFNDEMQELFGCPSAVMTQITSLLVPHIDVGAGAVEPSKVKGVSTKRGKRECVTPMKSQKTEAKTELQAKLSPKREAKLKTDVSAAAMPPEPGFEVLLPAKRLKSDPDSTLSTATDVEEASTAIRPRLTAIGCDSATVSFTAPPGAFRFLALAMPDASAEATDKGMKAFCKVEMHEMPDGSFEQHVKAHFSGLDPSMAYRVSIRVCTADACADDASREADSISAALPQRARPGDWAPHEVMLWSCSLQVPEFCKQMAEYNIDGTTLLSLGEEDLRGLGLAAPFLLRRVLAALEALRTA